MEGTLGGGAAREAPPLCRRGDGMRAAAVTTTGPPRRARDDVTWRDYQVQPLPQVRLTVPSAARDSVYTTPLRLSLANE
jgi:hypothetical protein